MWSCLSSKLQGCEKSKDLFFLSNCWELFWFINTQVATKQIRSPAGGSTANLFWAALHEAEGWGFFPACLSWVDRCNIFRCGPVLPGGTRSILGLWLSTRVSIYRISICASRFSDGSETILLAFSCRWHSLLRGSESMNAVQSDGVAFWCKKW